MNFYKIIRADKTHHGLVLKPGLNVDPKPWNPTGDCEEGGIYFAREDILAFLIYGEYISKVTIPEGTQVYENPGTPKKWKAPQVHLGRFYKITPKRIQLLIDEGADVHVQDDKALIDASKYGHTDIVKVLLKAGANVHTREDVALRDTSWLGHTDIVKALLKAGANVHTREDVALRDASWYGHTETVKVLLKAGANVHAQDDKYSQ